MNLSISAHHIDITQGIENHVRDKMRRVGRHFEHSIDVDVILSVERHEQKAEAKLHLYGKELFCESTQLDLYQAIDDLITKIDRTVLKQKERVKKRSADSIRYLQMAVGPV
jgi:putative sigma-54 modulation protein